MPKTTPTKQKTNNSSSSEDQFLAELGKLLGNLLTISNSSSTTRTNSSSTTPSSNSSSNTTFHYIPIKKSKKESDSKRFSRRLHYITCSSWITVDTYLEPLRANKKSVHQVKVGDKYHIIKYSVTTMKYKLIAFHLMEQCVQFHELILTKYMNLKIIKVQVSYNCNLNLIKVKVKLQLIH